MRGILYIVALFGNLGLLAVKHLGMVHLSGSCFYSTTALIISVELL